MLTMSPDAAHSLARSIQRGDDADGSKLHALREFYNECSPDEWMRLVVNKTLILDTIEN